MTTTKTTKTTDTTKPVPTKAQRDQIVAAVREAREATGSARLLQAKATHLVFSTPGTIGEHTGALYRTQGDYATAVGASNGGVTGLRTMGKALAGGVPESVVSDMSGVAGVKSVREAVDALNGTKKSHAAVVRAVAAAKRAKADATAKPADKRGPAKKSTDATPEESAPAMPRNNSGRLDVIETMLAALSSLSPAERKRLAEIGERVSLILTPAQEKKSA